MKFSTKGVLFIVVLLTFSGCVTSHYKNAKGEDCTRRYFTIMGIPVHSCSESVKAATPAPAVAAPSPTVASPIPAPTTSVPAPAVAVKTPESPPAVSAQEAQPASTPEPETPADEEIPAAVQK